MTLLEIFYYVIGYLYSLILGHYLIRWFSQTAWQALGEVKDGEKDMPYRWTSSLSGLIERAIYTSSIIFGAKEFIAVWLAFKVASQWKRWEAPKDVDKSRASFHVFVIGAGLSLMYGALGGMIPLWLTNGDFWVAGLLAVGVVGLNLCFYSVARKNKPARRKQERLESEVQEKIDG
jgi:hypothetical protein